MRKAHVHYNETTNFYCVKLILHCILKFSTIIVCESTGDKKLTIMNRPMTHLPYHCSTVSRNLQVPLCSAVLGGGVRTSAAESRSSVRAVKVSM